MSDKKLKKNTTLGDAKIIMLLVLIIIVVRSVFSFRVGGLTQITGADEFGTIASAAFFGGLDWSNMVSANCPYYGFGYSALLSWIFTLSDNAQFLHIAMTFMNTLLLCGVGIMAYTIMRRHFKVKDKRLSFMAALASALFFDSLVYANLVINETMLIFIIWLVLLILLEMSMTNNFFIRVLLSFILGIICSYSLMVHTRSIIIICAIVVAGIVMYFIDGDSYVSFFVFVPIIVSGYILSNAFVQMVQEELWKAGADTVLVNSTGSVLTSLSYISRLPEPGGLRGFLYAVIGQLYMLFSLSGGLLAIGIVTGIMILSVGIKYRHNHFEKNRSDDNSGDFTPFGIAACFIFSALMATLILNVASALRVTPEIMFGTENPGSQKWFLYVRYNALFCSPVVMMAFAFANRYRKKVRAALNWSVLLFVSINVLFFVFVAHYITGISSNLSGEFYFLFPLSSMKIGQNIMGSCFISMSIIAAIIFLIIYMCMRFDMGWIGALVFIILNVYIFGYISVNIHERNAEQTISYADCYESVIDSLEDVYEVPQIYIYRKNSGVVYAYSCQFALNRYGIIEGMPEDGGEAIVLSEREADEVFDSGEYEKFKLADNQIMYVRGRGLQDAVKNIVN